MYKNSIERKTRARASSRVNPEAFHLELQLYMDFRICKKDLHKSFDAGRRGGRIGI